MKTLVVFALAVAGMSQLVAGYWAGHWAGPYAAPVVTPGGFLADTPEVAAAKAAHFAKLAAAGAPVPPGYLGVYGVPVVTPSGFLADTPEVAAAKAAHLAELAKAGGAVPYAPYAPAYVPGNEGAYVPDANGW